VRLLVEAGADVNATDSVYHGTPAGWARHMREEGGKGEFEEMEAYLAGL
jgi:peptide-methionine (S)-S-oxide reductase